MLGAEIVRLAETTSTMDEVDARARAGAAEGLVVVADRQTAGRGRAGRSWASEPGAGLFCSVLLRPAVAPDRLGVLALVAGLAVAETIEALAPCRCGLKWPNDVFVGDEKVAGVLILARLAGESVEFVNAGFGVNLATPPEGLPAGGTSVLAASGVAVERNAFLASLLARLDGAYRRFVAGDVDLEPWLERARFLGEEVEVARDGGAVHGRFVDVSPDGGLILERPGGGRFEVVQGDLTRGPRQTG